MMEALAKRSERHLDWVVENVVNVGVDVLLAILFGDRHVGSVGHELDGDYLIEALTRDLEC